MLEPITAGEAGISAGREAADEGGAWKGLWAGLSAAWGEISGNLPYIKRRAHRHEPDKRRDRRGGHDKGRGGGRQQRAGVGHGVLAEYARIYYDEGRQALTADNTTKYQQLVEGGMSPGAAYETVRDG